MHMEQVQYSGFILMRCYSEDEDTVVTDQNNDINKPMLLLNRLGDKTTDRCLIEPVNMCTYQ